MYNISLLTKASHLCGHCVIYCIMLRRCRVDGYGRFTVTDLIPLSSKEIPIAQGVDAVTLFLVLVR